MTITLNVLPSCISVFGEFMANPSNKNIPQALPLCPACAGDTEVTNDSPSSDPPGFTIQWGRQTHLQAVMTQSVQSWDEGASRGRWTQLGQSGRASWRKLSPEGQGGVIQVKCDQGFAERSRGHCESPEKLTVSGGIQAEQER